MDLADAAKTARTQLCAEVCSRAGERCGERVAGAVYEGTTFAPTSVPCVASTDAGLADAGLADAEPGDAGLADAEPGDAGSSQPLLTQRPVPTDGTSAPLQKLEALGLAASPGGGAPTPATCARVCTSPGDTTGNGQWTCTVTQAGASLACKFPGGTIYGNCGGAGRAPAGLVPPRPSAEGGHLGQYWRALQYLEAASVPAFRELAEELTAHDAPIDLVRRAERAARDEVRHAAMAARELAIHGLSPAPLRRKAGATQRRGLFELAQDNAREGCVRESFAALLARHQSRAAASARMRKLFARIARDEADHAQLAWDVHAWATTRLDASERAHLEATLERAADELRQEHAAPGARTEPELADVGLDDGAHRARLALAFARAVTGARDASLPIGTC